MSEPVILSETLPAWVMCAVADAADLNTRREEALDHYANGLATCRRGLPVDWRYVALRMAEALAVVDGKEDLESPPEVG